MSGGPTVDIADPRDPTARAVRELIDLEGGPLVPAALGQALRSDDFLHAMVSLNFLQETLNRRSADNGGPQVSVHLTRSPSMRTSMRRVAADHAAVLVPVGTLARLQVMHRLLLGYWTRQEPPPRFIASIMDRPFERAIPRALGPLLRDLDGAAGELGWWQALDALNAQIALDAAFEPDVGELNHLALSLLLSHEFAHVARHHHDLRRRVRAGELAFVVGDGDDRRPATDAELRRAMENDADRVAAYLVVLTLVGQVRDQPESLPRGYLRLGYALTALLALFDPQRLSLMDFGKGSAYPHPLVRFDAYLADATECAAAIDQEAAFEAYSTQGSKRCLDALGLLEFEIYAQRRFCADDEKPEPVIHALRGSESNLFTLARERAAEKALTLRLGTLIDDTYGEFNF